MSSDFAHSAGGAAGEKNGQKTTTTADEVDPQRLYELEHELAVFQLTASEVDGFAAVFFKLKGEQKLADNAKLNAWLDPAVDRFKALRTSDAVEAGQQRQEEFHGKLRAFKNIYGFLGQVVPFPDPDLDLEKLYTFVTGNSAAFFPPGAESGQWSPLLATDEGLPGCRPISARPGAAGHNGRRCSRALRAAA